MKGIYIPLDVEKKKKKGGLMKKEVEKEQVLKKKLNRKIITEDTNKEVSGRKIIQTMYVQIEKGIQVR